MLEAFQDGVLHVAAFGPTARRALGAVAAIARQRNVTDIDLLQCLLSRPESLLAVALASIGHDPPSALRKLGGAFVEPNPAAGGAIEEKRVSRLLRRVFDEAARMAWRERCPVIAESHLVRSHLDRVAGSEDNFYSNLGIDVARLRSVLEKQRVNQEEKPTAPTGAAVDDCGVSSGMLIEGRYRIERRLGGGAMGVVYSARDEKLLASDSTRVVIKIMRPELLGSGYNKHKFCQELESLTRVNHPHIVRVLGSGSLQNRAPFILMEYLDGVCLTKEIPPEGMPLDRVAVLVRQIGSALSVLHEAGILHCDLKPDNIILVGPGSGREFVKLIDFGVAKLTNSVIAANASGTRIGGTPNYASPEHLVGGGLAPASDVYSFGIIAYQMVTGRRPFTFETEIQLYNLQKGGVPVPPRALRPSLPEAAERAIVKALSHALDARFSKASEFGERLADALISRPAPGHSAAAPRAAREAAYLVVLELEAYAALPLDHQTERMAELDRVVRQSAHYQAAEVSDSVVWLPSTDAIFLLFFGDPVSPAGCALDVASAARQDPDLPVRTGIHTALAQRTNDAARGARIAASEIQDARRLCGFGDPGHVLVTGSMAAMLARLSDWAPRLTDLGNRALESGGLLHAFNLSTGVGGSPSRPSKWLADPPDPVASTCPPPSVPVSPTPVAAPEPAPAEPPMVAADRTAAPAKPATGTAARVVNERPSSREVPAKSKPTAVGGLSKARCAPETWTMLLAAVDSASRSGRGFVATEDILRGLYSDRALGLPAAIRRLGATWPFDSATGPPQAMQADNGTISCSKTVGAMLRVAARPGDALTKCSDILAAMLETGVGEAAVRLRENGVPRIECLTSRLFQTGATLALGEFDRNGGAAMVEAKEWAQRKAHTQIDCCHLLYALLSLEDGYLAGLLRAQAKDAAELADMLDNSIQAEGLSSSLRLHADFLSEELMSVLLTAERHAGLVPVGENHLFKPLHVLGGDAAKFLVKQGVRWRSLQ